MQIWSCGSHNNNIMARQNCGYRSNLLLHVCIAHRTHLFVAFALVHDFVSWSSSECTWRRLHCKRRKAITKRSSYLYHPRLHVNTHTAAIWVHFRHVLLRDNRPHPLVHSGLGRVAPVGSTSSITISIPTYDCQNLAPRTTTKCRIKCKCWQQQAWFKYAATIHFCLKDNVYRMDELLEKCSLGKVKPYFVAQLKNIRLWSKFCMVYHLSYLRTHTHSRILRHTHAHTHTHTQLLVYR